MRFPVNANRQKRCPVCKAAGSGTSPPADPRPETASLSFAVWHQAAKGQAGPYVLGLDLYLGWDAGVCSGPRSRTTLGAVVRAATLESPRAGDGAMQVRFCSIACLRQFLLSAVDELLQRPRRVNFAFGFKASQHCSILWRRGLMMRLVTLALLGLFATALIGAAEADGLAGTWRQETEGLGASYWELKPAGNGTYAAQEYGLGSVKGTARLRDGLLVIEFQHPDGGSDYYEWRVTGTTGSGRLVFVAADGNARVFEKSSVRFSGR